MPNNVKSVKLLYRATCDGWKSDDFHRQCDNQGPVNYLI